MVGFLLTRLLCVYFVKYVLFIYLIFIQTQYYNLVYTYSILNEFNDFVIKIVGATRCGTNFFENILRNLHSAYTVRFSVIQTLLLKFEGILSIPDTILIYQHENRF